MLLKLDYRFTDMPHLATSLVVIAFLLAAAELIRPGFVLPHTSLAVWILAALIALLLRKEALGTTERLVIYLSGVILITALISQAI